MAKEKTKRKDPILAALFNLIFPGAGYVYIGEVPLAALLAFSAIFLFFLAGQQSILMYIAPFVLFVISLFGIYDAYERARSPGERNAKKSITRLAIITVVLAVFLLGMPLTLGFVFFLARNDLGIPFLFIAPIVLLLVIWYMGKRMKLF